MYKLLVLALLSLSAYSSQAKRIEREEIDRYNEGVQRALRNGVKKLNSNDAYKFYQKAIAVGKIYVEIVEGYLYTFEEVTVQDTNCTKFDTPMEDFDYCKIDPEGAKAECSFQVFVRRELNPMNRYKVLNDDCRGLVRKQDE